MKTSILAICTVNALAAVVLCAVASAQHKDSIGTVEYSTAAIESLLVLAEQGNVFAQTSLGVAYDKGNGVGVDYREAVRWYRKAADQGYARSQYFLGHAYDKGKGVDEDKREALRWWRKAADQGHAPSQFVLGGAYQSGKGIAADMHEAVRWLRAAADQGHVAAQFALGYIYANGHAGFTTDKREAARWWRKASEQGDAWAQHSLGILYVLGEGVITDHREAFIWLSIAKANGNRKSAELLGHLLVPDSEIPSAQKEAARRLEAIDRRKEERARKSAANSDIVIAHKPKGTNIAAHVFENTWRSVVVVRNGDGQGSGVIVRPNIIATNCHVVDGRGKITVYKADNRRADTDTAFSATIRQSDEDKDFCLLDVGGLWGVPATVRKYDTLSVGEDVYGLGAPQGLDLSLSSGVISQLRAWGGNQFIQTDTAISPGSSGGGLFDSEGNLIGILTAKIIEKGAEGIGFAIPADLVLGY